MRDNFVCLLLLLVGPFLLCCLTQITLPLSLQNGNKPVSVENLLHNQDVLFQESFRLGNLKAVISGFVCVALLLFSSHLFTLGCIKNIPLSRHARLHFPTRVLLV